MAPSDDSPPSPGAAADRGPRALALLFDGLVRTARSGPGIARPTAERLAVTWREHPARRLRPTPDGLYCDDDLVLPADECGPWVLPVFVAGLRWLQPAPPPDGRPDPAPDDLLRLAVALGGPTPQGQGLTALQSWMWGDGAEGIALGLASSITDAFDAIDALRKEEEASALRGAGAEALDGVLLSSQDLDAAALSDELAAPLRLVQKGRRTLALDEALAARIRDAVQADATWAGLEARVVVRQPALRPSVPAPRLANRLADVLAARADARSLGLLAALAGADDDWSTALLAALADAGVGQAIARGLVLQDETAARALTELAPRLPHPVVGAAAVGLARRIATEGQGEPLLVGLLGIVPVEEVLPAAVAADLSADAAVVLARALGKAGAPQEALLDLLGALPPATLGPTLTTLSPDAADRLARPMLTRMLQHKGTVAAALELLQHRPSSDWRLVLRSLEQTGGEGWAAADLATACRELRSRGSGGATLVEWVRDGGRPERLRLAALDAVAEDPRLCEKALGRRASELLDPPALKARLKALRSAR